MINHPNYFKFIQAVSTLNEDQRWALQVAIMAERHRQTLSKPLAVPMDKSHMDVSYEWALGANSTNDTLPV